MPSKTRPEACRRAPLRLIGFGLTGLGFIDLGLRVFVEEHLLGFIGIEIFRPDVEEQLIAGLGFRI